MYFDKNTIMKPGEQHTASKMDEYDKKFAEMQKYIPFLEAMIERLQNVKDKSREVQLQKMQSLHGILSNSKRKLKIETLQRCEDVLQKLHNKVEKFQGNTPGLNFPNKKTEANLIQPVTATEDKNIEKSKSSGQSEQTNEAIEEKEIHETPASPSPPVSPDSGSQVAPIIIPTERSDFNDDKFDSKPASPDPIETLPTKAPIIIPTERTSNDLNLSPSIRHNTDRSEDVSFSEWDMLEENENQIARNKGWQSSSSNDVTAAIKLIGSKLPQKINESRSHMTMHSSRHIPTVPVPSLGGSRRLSSILEKNRLMGINLDMVSSDSRSESPVSVPDVRLKSPESDALFLKHKNTSPRLKDVLRPASKPPAPLLLSPPPVSTEPPLSMEDLAELLNEENDNKTEKKTEQSREDVTKFTKDSSAVNIKDSKSSRSFLLAQEDIDSDSERRWEEIDKHIVKLTSRKCLPSIVTKAEGVKSTETKGPTTSVAHNLNVEKLVDNRNQQSSPSSRTEPRYADNYERHPRQPRDNYSHDNVKDKANVHAHCRQFDDDISNPMHHSGLNKPDDKNILYQRRSGNVGPEISPKQDTEFRVENPEYFSRQMPNACPMDKRHWPSVEFCNNQWPPSSSFAGVLNPPYQHSMGLHQEMWNVGANRDSIHMDPHQMSEGQLRTTQFPSNMSSGGIRPLISPNARPQDKNHLRSDDIPNIDVPNVPTIQPLISPTRFPQYRNFQGENRPYEPTFDRRMEYSHAGQSGRSNDVPYRAENEAPCNVIGPTDVGPYSRPSTPCPWNRDRDRAGGRGRNVYYNERNRGESRSNFNRDTRRPEWLRDNHEWDNSNRFGRDVRNISDRDPRVRVEHNAVNQTASQSRDSSASIRDPRLAKDKHFQPAKGKEHVFNERDPRKRPVAPFLVRKAKEKVKSPTKSSDGSKQTQASKDKMQSRLESLYGVIDTKAKSAQGYCLQNFKIPKIKRNDSSESPTSSHILDEPKAIECSEGKVTKKDKDDTTGEVSSSSDGNVLLETWNDVPEKKEVSEKPVEDKDESNTEELNSISTTSPKSSGSIEKKEVDADAVKLKDEVTQEWVEALIRKSFEFGEGKKFVEQAKFMQKLGEVLQAKKLKKIKKIIESETESSSSEKDETLVTKKVQTRKKRRVIVSDSSDEESFQDSSGNDKTSDLKKDIENLTSDVASPKTDIVQDATSQDVPEETDLTNEKPISEKPEDSTMDSMTNESMEDKENASKTPKAKAKRRNSLEMLQEDIREMFISDDVVAATGHRLCRAQKESTNASTLKKDVEISSEIEGQTPKQKKPIKSRSSDENGKLKSKSKKEAQRITRQRSKQFNQSSDSEDDQPLALRTELAQNLSQEISNEESEVLRRSKRIINKETIKEPRVVVEKTDISKLDSSKVLFDSSSDESFGIDVSELAAAVDISLHPEKPTEVAEVTETKNEKQGSSKKTSKKASCKVVTTEEKRDDALLTDEESVISNISISSSIASKKRAAGNEELLSNILVGLVVSKSEEKDKESDADIDEDISDQLPTETNTRKSLAKKKKKKCNWQMGILSKKKRKRATTTSSLKENSDVNTSTETEGSTKTDTVDSADLTNNQYNLLQHTSKKDEDDVKITSASCDSNSSEQKASDSIVSCDVINNKENTESPVTGETSKTAVQNKEETGNYVYDLDINKLIDYAWTGQERYKCLLCMFTGKNIVHHYKVNHPGKEILISRLKIADAQLARQNAKDNDVENEPMDPLIDVCTFNCRFCSCFTEGTAKVATEAFYEHCTTHTGEYRFRCKSCPYQTVAKSSMRTHYYKVCRKFNDTFNEAITEDEIPEQNRVYGYLCSACNYVQLKKCNLEEHTKLWHAEDSNADIIKINMSLDVVKEPDEALRSDKIKVESSQPSLEKLQTMNDVSVEQNDDVSKLKSAENTKTCDSNEKIVDLPEKSMNETNNVEAQFDNDDKTSPQSDSDPSLPTGNLSIFVCPPELEKKEVEIQLERKRKMQEIIQNIGIKLQKDAAKKGFSIIDKLKDKMKTNLLAANNKDDASSSSSFQSSTELLFPNPKSPSAETNTASLPQEVATDKQCESSVSDVQPLSTECDPQSFDTDQSDAKVRDPLMTLDQKKSYESDLDTSDNENTQESNRIYESDSTSEQSDSEPPADVNMILKETSNIEAYSKAPMLTTIQRLAAQLQATKPLDVCKDKSPFTSRDSIDKTVSANLITITPDVVPIGNIKRYVGNLENRCHEISSEAHDDVNPPKNFIRLRRLSGDMLSVPTPPNAQDDESLLKHNESESQNTPDTIETVFRTEGEEECSFLKIENVVSLAPKANNDDTESPIVNDIRKAVETSPIRSKGVSVLKKSNSPLILKRLNAMAITQPLTKNMQSSTSETLKLIPVKSLSPSPKSVTTAQLAKNFIPIAPKSKIIQVDNKLPFSLSVNKNTCVTSVSTRTMTVTGSSQASNLNYKIVKVVRTPTILKPKDSTSSPTANKLKSADAYSAMLKTVKLTHLYKCMARDCSFTTDVLTQYHQHYLQHESDSEKRNVTPPFDYQKCAYCYMVLEDWNRMKMHLEEKHAHCRYQCSYCFYRAIAPSYVQIHQTISHPGQHGILLGKLIKDIPLKEDVNRHDHINPYVCQHGCGKFFYLPKSFMAHLKHKHGLLFAFTCHICHFTCTKVEQLITHYKTHGFHKYHCLYCVNGSDTFSDMHSHLSTFHCNRLPQILERSLPSQPVRSKDVLEQLLVRTLDDNFKAVEEIIDVESDGKDAKESVLIDIVNTSPAHHRSSPQLSKEFNMLNQGENEALNKSMSSLFGSTSNQTINSGSVSFLQNDTTLVNENITNKAFESTNNSDISVTTISNAETTNKNSVVISVKNSSILVDGNSVESLEPSGKFDCSDEFVNINLLDNPDFLKNVNSHSSETFIDNTTTAVNESKTEDSDIEIVNIDDTDNSITKDTASLFDSNKEDEKIKIDNYIQETDTKELPCNDYENSNMSTDTDTNNENSTAIARTDKPLTLEDIKDTGYTGTKLYKCGYETCDYGAQTAVVLRNHARECSFGGDNKNLTCAHCNKRFIKIGFLLEHLKLHGLKRFGCSLCKMRCTVGYQAMAHMKTKHKFANSKLVPADPKNPSVDGLFIVQPIHQTGDRKGKKRKSIKSVEKEGEKVVNDTEKLSFSPDEIESLPRQAIYNRVVQCAVCPYTTKVRTNIIRHLLLHAKDESVPESGPVNPVPCLDKKERMFDKMVNLASSSHQNGRMGGKPKECTKDNDDEFIPKFVPEHKRYVCGVVECNYLTVDEAMLRYHLKALHSEEPYFRCPHCPQPVPGQEGLNIAIDKMGVHLKMHDTRLYKCSHCNHHHYHRHVVERHLSDKHPEKRPFVKVIRELESTENNQQSTQEEIEEEVPDPDGNHWKCNICDYKCVYKAEMVNHTTTAHDEKCQYKCTLCSFKTSGKILFEQHINSKHSSDPNVDYILIYQRIKGVNKKTTDYIEQSGQEEPFDTTPLWRRDMPRVRHIRGILLEDENEMTTESSLRTGKRKSDVELPAAKPAKIKPGKSGSLDDTKQPKEKCKRSLSYDKVSLGTENEESDTSGKAKEVKVKSIEDHEVNDTDVGRFGPYGKPDCNMYVCTLCTQFKSKYKHDMRDHLYRELNYARWHCKECGYLSVNRNALLKHFTKHHNGERPNHEPLSPDNDIEDWVGTLLKRQTIEIKEFLSRQITNTTGSSANTSQNDNSKSSSKTSQNVVTKMSKTAKTLQDSVFQSAAVDADAREDSKDNEGLTSDIKNEISLQKEKPENVTGTDKAGTKDDQEKPLICKHCKMTFTRWRGFKLHVQLTHLKRLGFVCPYCDRSTNSETLMRQHIRSKHPGCTEKLVQNPAAGGPELSEEFWQKEYGIVFPKKSKKRKRKVSGGDAVDNENHEQSESQGKCNLCGFAAMNLAGLKAHMRIHMPKNLLECSYCAFTTSVKSELWEHWELNHPFKPPKLEDTSTPELSEEPEHTQMNKKTVIDDYSDDIEEERISDVKDNELLYSCFYCSFRSESLDDVQNHWCAVHKESKLSSDSPKLKTNLPFRYKEIRMSEKSSVKTQNSEIPYKVYVQDSQSEVQILETAGVKQDNWICQWCNEVCGSEVKMKTHHSMFHSHLPLNFKKQDKNKTPRGYVCPECSFTTTFINTMKNHVSKHINLFKCKYCDETFSSPTLVSSHNAEEHPELELKIESIQNYDVLIEKLMTKVKWQKLNTDTNNSEEEEIVFNLQRNHAVARKSTAKSTIRSNLLPYKVKAVARKSTNPHSRFPGTNREQLAKSRSVSYYGVPASPVNLAKLNTYMVVGGHRMKVNCTTLAQLININPKIVLKDLKYGIKDNASLTKFK